jgi:hypothetical protein
MEQLNLQEYGYQFLPNPGSDGDGHYFLEVRDKIGIKYHITCTQNEFEARLIYTNKNVFTVNLQAYDFGYNLKKIHKFIDGIWKNASCGYHVKFVNTNPKWRQKDLLEQIAEEKQDKNDKEL